jgi:hypothetical protein
MFPGSDKFEQMTSELLKNTPLFVLKIVHTEIICSSGKYRETDGGCVVINDVLTVVIS